MLLLLIPFSTFRLFMYCWITLAVAVFFLLLKVTAPYGRHTTSGWGPMVSNRLGWVVMEVPVLLVLWAILLPYRQQLSLSTWTMIILFSFHYLNRTFVFPFRIHTRGKKMPAVIVGSGIFFNLVNGFSLGYYFAHFSNPATNRFADPWFIVGMLMFFGGMLINWAADEKLIGLRKPNETHYVIPQKWLFEWVSCPNLLGELVEWLGFALLCWNLPALGFFIWTAANLVPRALSHHKWYRKKFSEYPSRRKAIIPYWI
jgi:3-oxo-5-alpha-steroid 4-dehydrogenase 1